MIDNAEPSVKDHISTGRESLPGIAAEGKFVRAMRGESFGVPPVWLMRQAGRYLPEYNAIRGKYDFITVCRTPELATEVTLQPIRRFGFDAAILFSDILIPFIPMGAGLSFDKGHGPRVGRPVRNSADLRLLREFDPREELADVIEAVRMIRTELRRETALIGFCGAPFTLACYLIEGGKPDPFTHVKRLMYGDPAAFSSLMERLATMTADYLIAMYEAGANTVQLFDTWAGVLSEREYRAVNLPVVKKIISRLKDKRIPSTYFALNGMHLLSAIDETGADAIGLDWRMPIDAARRVLKGKTLQGNLDPIVLLTNETTIRRETRRVLNEAQNGPFIFNLGHGIQPDTPIASVEVMLNTLRESRS